MPPWIRIVLYQLSVAASLLSVAFAARFVFDVDLSKLPLKGVALFAGAFWSAKDHGVTSSWRERIGLVAWLSALYGVLLAIILYAPDTGVAARLSLVLYGVLFAAIVQTVGLAAGARVRR